MKPLFFSFALFSQDTLLLAERDGRLQLPRCETFGAELPERCISRAFEGIAQIVQYGTLRQVAPVHDIEIDGRLSDAVVYEMQNFQAIVPELSPVKWRPHSLRNLQDLRHLVIGAPPTFAQVA